MVPHGFYLVHRYSLPATRLDISDFIKRKSLTHYPQFARYKIFVDGDYYFVVNGRGNLIVFQRLAQTDFADALQTFTQDEPYNAAYAAGLRAARNFFNLTIDEFGETFFLQVGAQDLAVSWNRVFLPATRPWEIYILIESVFVTGLCKDAEHCLANLLSNRSIGSPVRNLVDYVRDVIFVEQPQHFLISSDEITLAEEFYKTWKISDSVKSLQTRFSQAIDTFNLSYGRIQAQRAMTLNRFVGAATVIALLQVSDNLSIPILGIEGDLVKGIIFGIAGILVVWGYAADVWRKGQDLAWHWVYERPINRRVRWIERHPPPDRDVSRNS